MSALCMNLCGPVENHDCHVVYCKRLTVTRLDSFNTMMLLVKPCIRLALQEKRPGWSTYAYRTPADIVK